MNRRQEECSMFNPTGITRRIDDLGRVFIPKDLRRTLGILDGDMMDVHIDKENGIVAYKRVDSVGGIKRLLDMLHEEVSDYVLQDIDNKHEINQCIAELRNLICKAEKSRRETSEQLAKGDN